MYFFYVVPLPPNTPVTNPVIMLEPIQAGLLTFMEVEFPLRCEGLAKLKIKYNTKQIVPFNPPGWLYGDNRVFKLDLNYSIDDPPYQLEFIGYNEDDTYLHTLTVGVMVQSIIHKPFEDLIMEAV